MLAEQLHVTVLPHDRRLELIQLLNKIIYSLSPTPRSCNILLEADSHSLPIVFVPFLFFVLKYLLPSNFRSLIFPYLLEIDAPLSI